MQALAAKWRHEFWSLAQSRMRRCGWEDVFRGMVGWGLHLTKKRLDEYGTAMWKLTISWKTWILGSCGIFSNRTLSSWLKNQFRGRHNSRIKACTPGFTHSPTPWPFFRGLGHSGSVPDFGAESFACGMCYGPLLPGLWEKRGSFPGWAEAHWEQRIISSPFLSNFHLKWTHINLPSFKLGQLQLCIFRSWWRINPMRIISWCCSPEECFEIRALHRSCSVQVADLHLQRGSGRIASTCNQHKDHRKTRSWNHCPFHLPLPHQDLSSISYKNCIAEMFETGLQIGFKHEVLGRRKNWLVMKGSLRSSQSAQTQAQIGVPGCDCFEFFVVTGQTRHCQ